MGKVDYDTPMAYIQTMGSADDTQIDSGAQYLPRAPKILYFYGLTGSGKSYIGDLLGTLGWRVYHADVDLTQEMKDAIQKKEHFTPEMRDAFYAVVANRIHELAPLAGRLVVTQATYKQQHRAYLRQAIPGIELICVSAPEELIIKRLRERGDIISLEYAAQIAKNFEAPNSSERVLHNSGDDREILRQLEGWYGDSSGRNRT